MSVPTNNIDPNAPVTSGEFNIIMGYTPPPSAFIFSFENKMVTFSFESGMLTVKSDLPFDETAKEFLNYLKPYIDQYVKSVVPHNNLKYLEWCANEGKKHE